MADDGELLLAAVLRFPAEDTPRLVFADWLQERGEEDRAEFIRVQCRIAELNHEAMSDEDCEDSRCVICSERRPLAARERHLIERRSFDWLEASAPEGLFSVGGVSGPSVPPNHGAWCRDIADEFLYVTFRRGFVGEVTCSAADWLAHGDAITAAHPVTRVRLTTFPDFGWQMDNMPPNWPLGSRAGENGITDPRLFALDALGHRWPGVAFELPGPRFTMSQGATATGLPLTSG